MKIAITGGQGFVGRNTAALLTARGHEVVIISRVRSRGAVAPAGARIAPVGLHSVTALQREFAGCGAVVHCAGINRELGSRTYAAVHVAGTRNVVAAAELAGVGKIILTSFLRARPDCGSAYHESKWAAEEIVRSSGLDYTVLKCGVIYGRGDHMLDHLGKAFHTFPVFAWVGFADQPIRPIAIADVARIIAASVLEGALSRQTVFVVGPETLTLRQAVRRVANVAGRRPLMFPLPVWFHYLLGWMLERVMKSPMVSVSQVRMLREGLAEPAGGGGSLPPELAPVTPFSDEQIRRGLPVPGPFRWREFTLCPQRANCVGRHCRHAFFEMP